MFERKEKNLQAGVTKKVRPIKKSNRYWKNVNEYRRKIKKFQKRNSIT